MNVSTRIIDYDNTHTLYIGDIIEGAEAASQMAQGNADLIEEEAPEAATPKEEAEADSA